MIRRLYPYWRNVWRETAAGAGLLIFAAALELLQPWPIKWLVDYVFGSQPAPEWLGRLMPPFASHNVGGGITAVCITILLLAVGHRLVYVLSNALIIRAGGRLVLQLRCQACDHLHRLSLAYHDRTKVGESLYRVAYDAHAAQTLLSGAIMPIVTGVLLLVGILVVMVRIDLWLTAVTLAAAPLFYLLIRLFGRKIDDYSKRYHQHESSLVSTVQESLSSIRAVQAFTLEPETGLRFRSQAEESLDAHQKLTRTQLVFAGLVGIAMAAGTVAVVWFGAHRVADGRLLLGDILVFLAYLGMLYQPINAFCQSSSVGQSAAAQLRRVFEVLDQAPEVIDRPGARALPSVQGHVEFRGVSFQYDATRAVLREVSFVANPGSVTAIVGRTGAGKSTLASLLLRFYDPKQGAVTLDGHDLRDLKLAWLRQQVSVVLQDPILFSASIRENIAFGLPGATRQQIEDAARRAQIDAFIRSLPQGYDTSLGERGVNLSGGQRQRLSIARALLKNAPILVLDEPTSALDSETEEALLACLKELMAGRTTFIIAHRLSTVRVANQIIVLDNGRIAERGTHEELMRVHTMYRRMYETQWGGTTSGDLALAGKV